MGYGLLLGDAPWFIGDNYDFIAPFWKTSAVLVTDIEES